jgi:hypothetical protein
LLDNAKPIGCEARNVGFAAFYETGNCATLHDSGIFQTKDVLSIHTAESKKPLFLYTAPSARNPEIIIIPDC